MSIVHTATVISFAIHKVFCNLSFTASPYFSPYNSRLMLKTIGLVFLGGGIGSSFRYLNSVWVGKYFPSQFPIATFLTNITGCLLIGILLGIAERQQFSSTDFKFFFITGFCGGYTTFSAFSAENFTMIQNGQMLQAMLYIGLSLFVGILATWVGVVIAK